MVQFDPNMLCRHVRFWAPGLCYVPSSPMVRLSVKRFVRLALLVVFVLMLVAGGLVWNHYRLASRLPDGVLAGNGRLELTRIDVAVQYPGRVIRLMAREGDNVTAGQVLAQQDTTTVDAQYAQAQAEQARAAGAVGRAEAERQARQAALDLARDELRHARTMRAQALVSDMEVKQRSTAVDAASAAVTAASRAVDEARAAEAAVQAKMAQVRSIIHDMTIVAPVAGRIEYRVVETGSVLPPGGRVFAMLDPVDPYMTIFLPTAAVSRLKVGDDAVIALDGMERSIPARLCFVDDEAQFTPKYVETASEREQLVYRVKLCVTPAAQRALGGMLKAGMTGEGYVRTSPTAGWPDGLTRHGMVQ